ncbi:MAG: type I-U CRISPR-associated helicase/endonuclease Cas3, partial [Alphaproteobacteria bacterium]|nr:type I-U CRISPR-associated helicase/endonuclease Cas3 [Alphaproteobacteria bacterium]
MTGLTADQFAEFFEQLHGRDPFPWQEDLARRVCGEGWPAVIDLPTASGKTACIDIALFALACAPENPRRIFFVVDRRIIVDEAYERVKRISGRLRDANDGALGLVSRRLREISGSEDPLHVFQLRGGIYRDQSWMRSPRQATVVTSTVDQVGSRILFRGYGVRDVTLPLHAAMTGNDALILLDEAHCSRPFAETLARVERYRGSGWREREFETPFHFVQMTATPAGVSGEVPFAISEKDRTHHVFSARLGAAKMTRLVPVKVRTDDAAKLAEILVRQARELVKQDPEIRRVAIMVNRVATARSAHDLLGEREEKHLLIGRMRPVDRDDVVARLEPLKSGRKRMPSDPLRFVVATQCLEVGADLDFDALVTECASMDALLQRFGRLNRLGDHRAARGVVVLPEIDPKRPDPVYGEAL